MRFNLGRLNEGLRVHLFFEASSFLYFRLTRNMLGGTIKLNPLGVLLIIGSIILVLLFYLRSSSEPASTIKLRTLLIESIIAAEKGGLQVKNVHDNAELNIKSKGKTKEGANNPLTDADLKSHYAMIKSLEVALGNDAIKVISEEHAYSDAFDQIENSDHNIELTEINKIQGDETVNLQDVVVWIDPLDATQEFTEDLLQYVTVMVCVAVRGKPVIGVVHKPFQKETVWAWVGYGVSENLHPFMELSKPEKLKIIVSRSHSGAVEQVAKLAFGANIEIIPAGGAGYKVTQVISGGADVYVHVTQIKKWDLCAGHALLNAVGGEITTLDGSSINYSKHNGVVNEGGLLATLHNHELYLKSLVKLQNKVGS